MSLTDPITNADTLLRTALTAALSPVPGTFDGAPALFFRLPVPGLAPALLSGSLTGALACRFLAPQERGALGAAGVTVVVTLTAYASAQGDAEALRDAAAQALPTLSLPAGYQLKELRFTGSPTVVSGDPGLSAAAAEYRIRIQRTP
jgi:hypothetical protein